MGRFKIYDAKSLVTVQENDKYAKCLVCEKVLKNIMGNIKRHYEQIHDTVLESTIATTKKPKRKAYTDNNYRPAGKIRKKAIKNSSKVNETNDEYDWIDEYQLDCETRPAITIVSTPSGNKIYQQLETRILNACDTIPTAKEVFPNTSNIVIKKEVETLAQNPTISNSQFHNIRIVSIDCQENAAASYLKCMLTNKTLLNIPLQNFQQSSTFQSALKSWCSDNDVGLQNKTICQHLDNMIKQLSDNIKRFAANRFIYLKLDIVDQPTNLMLVNIQFMKDFEIKIFTLSVLELLDDHNAPILKGKLINALKRYDIDISQVISITKDYTNNVRETVSYPNEEEKTTNENSTHEYCQYMSEHFPGHVLHFVACDIIKQLNENISQNRDSAINLHKRMVELNIKPIPMLDNPKCWISVYDMIKSLFDIREKIENNSKLFVEVDWLFVSKFVTSFKPVVDAVINLQSNHFIMGDLYRDWLVCESELEELSATNEIALYLLQTLRKRKVHLFENDSFLAALYLDPRFCYMGSMHFNDKQKHLAITQLLTIFNKLKSLDKTKNNLNTKHNDNKVNERYLKLEKKTAANMGICNKMKTVLQSNFINGSVSLESVDSQTIEEALEQLQFDERLPFHANILDYWKAIAYKNPVLARLAEIALATPATQTTVNRVFNVLPFMRIKHKNKISLDNLENIFLLYLNQDLVDKL